MSTLDENATVTQQGLVDMQVCIPAAWSDRDVKAFADREYPCGTEHGWFIRKEGDAGLKGDPERSPCKTRTGFVHVMLDA